MISQIDEQLRDTVGIGAPIRYNLFMDLVKLKTFKPLDGKRIQIRVKAMDNEQKIDVLADNLIRDHPVSAAALMTEG